MFTVILTAGPCFLSPKMETESDKSLSQAAVTEHFAKKPMPNPRGAASHAGVKKAFDKRVRITEEQKADTVVMSYTDFGECCKEQVKLDKFYQMQLYVNG